MASGRIPVTVVAGGPRSGKSRLIAQLRASCPPGERWAYLGNSVAAGAPAGPGAELEIPADQRFAVAGGCACCLAGPVFRTTLVRLLRAGPWQRLHLEVDPQGHPHLLTDQLRQPPFDQYLQVTQLLLTLRGDEAPEELRAVPGPLEWASDFLLRTRRADPGGIDLVAAGLQAAPPWPRREHAGASASIPAGPHVLPALPGWRRFSLENTAAPDGNEVSADLQRCWPAGTIFERRPLEAQLAALANESGVTGFQASMRTPRAWYGWRFGRGRGTGPLDFDAGVRLVAAETAWRLDSRIALWLAPGTVRDAVLTRLQDLERH